MSLMQTIQSLLVFKRTSGRS